METVLYKRNTLSVQLHAYLRHITKLASSAGVSHHRSHAAGKLPSIENYADPDVSQGKRI